MNVPEQPAEPGIYVIDMPGSVQSVLRIGRRALPVDATGPYFYGQLMNYNLGATLTVASTRTCGRTRATPTAPIPTSAATVRRGCL
ncbi:hypothetical protein MBH78_10340 [Oceanimonas sp. NS1]|nr:hypothetical protein [Oceanimonas sp. NS1]